MPFLHNTDLGKTGEDLACAELRRRGYAILERRYRTRVGELDIVARDGATIVFIEVKTRTGDRFGNGLEAVTGRKQSKLQAMATDYVFRRRLIEVPCRFDVVSVTMEEGVAPRVEIVAGAFLPSASRF